VVRHSRTGPLRVLQSLYPQGETVCHNVLIHPPGGLVGGYTLDLAVQLQEGAHGLITTPGATRFYRSEGEVALQHSHLHLHTGARLQWLPQEAICYSGCIAENRVPLQLSPGAELIGWDITALGLPHAKQPFIRGSLRQHIEFPGVWMERGTINACDQRLLRSPVGLAGQNCMATAFFVAGSTLDRQRRQVALDCARQTIAENTLSTTSGATSPHPQVIVARVLAPLMEPAMELLRALRICWLAALWGSAATTPRIWAT